MRDTTSRYFDEVSRLELPTQAQERAGLLDYWQLTQAHERETDPSKREQIARQRARRGQKIAEGYLRFVIGKARDRTRDEDLLLDFIGAGNEGLMIAITKFDPAYDVRFLTYAAPWVRVKMDEVAHRLGTVHVSVHQRKQCIQRGEEPPTATLTHVDDVQLVSPSDVEREAVPEGRTALKYLKLTGLSRRERVILVLSLGLRGDPQGDEDLALTLYSLDGSIFCAPELRRIREEALGKMRRWAGEHPDEEMFAELS